MQNQTLKKKIFHFALTKITIGIFVCVGIVIIGQMILGKFLDFTLININKEYKDLIIGIFVSTLSLLSYIQLFKMYEKRDISELSTKNLIKNLGLGLFIGIFLQSLTILVIYLNNGFFVISINSFLSIIPALSMAFTSAIFEEILFRGIIFRITEEKLGSYIALLISGLFFGFLHLTNPHSSLTYALGIAIQAGFLLGVAYIFSRNLWFPIAIHFSWNFSQSGIFGANTSGITIGKSLLTTKIQGSELITGGNFGPEGSIQATLLCLIGSVILLILCYKNHKIINPYWLK
jgi:uncharacterized protein